MDNSLILALIGSVASLLVAAMQLCVLPAVALSGSSHGTLFVGCGVRAVRSKWVS